MSGQNGVKGGKKLILTLYGNSTKKTILDADEVLEILPSLDFAEIEGDCSVGDRLLAQVLGVAPHERRHVVTWKRWPRIL